jgi:phage terminase small subunit
MATKKAPTLTAKQERFIQEYLIDLNATQAAIRSGYSAKTADKIGSQLLGKTRVAQAIAAAQQKRSERTQITADYVLTTIQETVERCKQAAPVLDRKGEQVYVEGPDGRLVPAYTFEPQAVLKGAELLGKHLKLFTEKTELSGPEGGAIALTMEQIAANPKSRLSVG